MLSLGEGGLQQRTWHRINRVLAEELRINIATSEMLVNPGGLRCSWDHTSTTRGRQKSQKSEPGSVGTNSVAIIRLSPYYLWGQEKEKIFPPAHLKAALVSLAPVASRSESNDPSLTTLEEEHLHSTSTLTAAITKSTK